MWSFAWTHISCLGPWLAFAGGVGGVLGVVPVPVPGFPVSVFGSFTATLEFVAFGRNVQAANAAPTITAMSTATAVFRRIMFRLSFSPSRVVSRRSRCRGERIVHQEPAERSPFPSLRARIPFRTLVAGRPRIVDNPFRVRHRDLTKASCARVAIVHLPSERRSCIDKDRTMK